MRRFPGPVPVTAMTNQLNPIGEELRILQSQVEVFTPAEVLMLRRRFFPSEKYWPVRCRPRRGTNLSCSRLLNACFTVFLARSLVLLATWFPGDETIRFSSEGPLRLMFSRSGLSFGNQHELHFKREIKLDTREDSIKRTRAPSTVQGKISQRPSSVSYTHLRAHET